VNFEFVWSNPSDAYLTMSGDPVTVAKVGGSAATRLSASPGRISFQHTGLADSDRVLVTIDFRPTFRAVTASVLRIAQTYVVSHSGTQLALETPPGNPLLVHTHTGGPGVGSVRFFLDTTFVDLDNHFFDAAIRGPHPDRRAEVASAGCRLHALGFTGGKPELWFALVPLASETWNQGDEVDALVFYRHENSDYDHLTTFAGGNFAFNLNEVNHFVLGGATFFDPSGGLLPSKFASSLGDSKRHLVMLLPWCHGNDGFFKSTDPNMPDLVERALLLLRGQLQLSQPREKVKLARLGVCAFSSSGPNVITALRNNAGHPTPIQEVYWFDANWFMPAEKPKSRPPSAADLAALNAAMGRRSAVLLKWFRGAGDDARLRMTGGQSALLQGSIERALAGEPRARTRVFSYPPGPPEAFYRPRGVNPWWDWCVHDDAIPAQAGLRLSVDRARHHFCLVGGEAGFTAARQAGTLWLSQFLETSAFRGTAPRTPRWSHWPAPFEAGARGGLVYTNKQRAKQTAYFFLGSEYLAFDVTAQEVFPDTRTPAALGKWPGLPFSSVDAAVMRDGTQAYFFSGSEWVYYDTDVDKSLDASGRKMTEWLALPRAWHAVQPGKNRCIDAAVLVSGNIHFFRGDEVLVHSRTGNTLVAAPRKITAVYQGWPVSFAADLDGGVAWDGKLFFFKGGRFIQVNESSLTVELGFPRSIIDP